MTIRDLPPSVLAFARAVGAGGLAGAAPFSLVSVPIGLFTLFSDNSGPEWWTGFIVAVSPLLISLPVVLAASITLGLPLTAFLSNLGKESGQTYVVCGFLLGAAPFIALMVAIGEFGAGLIAVSGGLGGAVTGWVWGRHRDQLAADQQLDEAS